MEVGPWGARGRTDAGAAAMREGEAQQGLQTAGKKEKNDQKSTINSAPTTCAAVC